MTPIQYEASFNTDELEQLTFGFIPSEMEDKWFVYFNNNVLYFHRSWTGQGVFQVHLSVNPQGANVEKAFASFDHELSEDNLAYYPELLSFLVSNLLLGRQESFPLPHGYEDKVPGLLQHTISGTGYRQKPAGGEADGQTDDPEEPKTER